MRLGVFAPHGLDAFSGIPRNLTGALRRCEGVEVVALEPGRPYRPGLAKRLRVAALDRVAGVQYLWEKEPARCRHVSAAIDAAVLEFGVDAVLLFGSEGCAYCETHVPLHCYADSIFGSRVGLYPDQRERGIAKASVREGVAVQQRALERLTSLFISSRWAADRAVERFGYRLAPGTVEVVGIGANLPVAPRPDVLGGERGVGAGFVWVGNFWERKGGDVAVAAVEALRSRGVAARLDVIGAVDADPSREGVRWHGRLDYGREQDRERLHAAFAGADAMLLPTRGDLTPIGICEAFAHSRPVCATPVGAIPEMLDDGVTGLLLPPDEPLVWAERLEQALRSGALAGMRAAARRRYEEHCTWDRVAARMLVRMRGMAGRGGAVPVGGGDAR